MTAKRKQSQNVEVVESVEQESLNAAEHISQQDQDVSLAKERAKTSADFAEYVQDQFNGIKDEVKQRFDNITAKFPLKPEDLAVLKNTLKEEFAHLLEDLAQTSKEFKAEVTEISLKHKDHLSETFKRTKDQTVEVLSKINLSAVKGDDQPQA